MSDSPGFDAESYKSNTHKQWDKTAEAWDKWGSVLESWLGTATEAMLDKAGVKPGGRVLDIAAGTGGQTLAAARRVGPEGSVLATDISLEILKYAQSNAQSQGLTNVQIHQVDGETLDFQNEFDAAISRVGLIYFPDQVKALAGIRKCLKPGGKFATVTYSTPDKNLYFSLPVGIIRRRANLPPPPPGHPGPFSLADPAVFQSVLERAGFVDVEIVKFDSPLILDSVEECLQFEKESWGALQVMMSSLSPEEQANTWREVEDALRQFATPSGFHSPCELLIGSGVNPKT